MPIVTQFLSLSLAAMLGLGIAAPGQAQHPNREVTGVVTDTAGKPIANAAVLVLGTPIAAITDILGRYRLCQLPAPTAMLRAAFINYRPLVKDSVALRDSVTVVDFRLAYSPITDNTIYIDGRSYLIGNDRSGFIDGRGRADSVSRAAPGPPPPPTCYRLGP